jgi:hypothetical protein
VVTGISQTVMGRTGQARCARGERNQEGLGRFTKVATFDVKTLESLRRDDGPPEEKVFNLLRGLNREIEENPGRAAVLQSTKEKVDRVVATAWLPRYD